MSTKRQHRPTSKEGEEYIEPFKPNHKEKIKSGLEKLRVGGTQEEIAEVTGLRADQVWKRMTDLKEDGDVFDTGITRKLKSGVSGIVWQKTGMNVSDEAPVIKKNGHSKELIKSTRKKTEPVHNPLFDNLKF